MSPRTPWRHDRPAVRRPGVHAAVAVAVLLHGGEHQPAGVAGTADDADIYLWNDGPRLQPGDRRDRHREPACRRRQRRRLRPGGRHPLLRVVLRRRHDRPARPGPHGPGRGRRRTTTATAGRSTSTAARCGSATSRQPRHRCDQHRRPGTRYLLLDREHATHRAWPALATTRTSTAGTARPLTRVAMRRAQPSPGPLPAGPTSTASCEWTAPTSTCPSRATSRSLAPGPDLPVQDEDVVYYNAGTWSVYFNGTARGLTGGNLDIDAFDLP